MLCRRLHGLRMVCALWYLHENAGNLWEPSTESASGGECAPAIIIDPKRISEDERSGIMPIFNWLMLRVEDRGSPVPFTCQAGSVARARRRFS